MEIPRGCLMSFKPQDLDDASLPLLAQNGMTHMAQKRRALLSTTLTWAASKEITWAGWTPVIPSRGRTSLAQTQSRTRSKTRTDPESPKQPFSLPFSMDSPIPRTPYTNGAPAQHKHNLRPTGQITAISFQCRHFQVSKPPYIPHRQKQQQPFSIRHTLRKVEKRPSLPNGGEPLLRALTEELSENSDIDITFSGLLDSWFSKCKQLL